ncbi:hypothetical protein HMI55_002742, partial [Coelomomyces lativittatus]
MEIEYMWSEVDFEDYLKLHKVKASHQVTFVVDNSNAMCRHLPKLNSEIFPILTNYFTNVLPKSPEYTNVQFSFVFYGSNKSSCPPFEIEPLVTSWDSALSLLQKIDGTGGNPYQNEVFDGILKAIELFNSTDESTSRFIFLLTASQPVDQPLYSSSILSLNECTSLKIGDYLYQNHIQFMALTTFRPNPMFNSFLNIVQSSSKESNAFKGFNFYYDKVLLPPLSK